MLMISPEYKCSNEILTITAMLSGMLQIFLRCPRAFLTKVFHITVPTIWHRPPNQRREADAAKALLTVPDGDHLTLMNVYNKYMQSAYLCTSSRVFLDVFFLQTSMTRTGRGQIIYHCGLFSKPKMSERSFSARWRGLRLN
jgi:HrpA-like RNA helicase